MNLLLDENLSPRLIQRLSSLFRRLIHVRDVGLKQASDETIWDWAKTHSFTVVTTDADFVALSLGRGWPPKVIHLEECDFPLRVIEELRSEYVLAVSGPQFERGKLVAWRAPISKSYPTRMVSQRRSLYL